MNKKEFDKWMLNQKVLADNFKLSPLDIHNLYDIFWIIDTPWEIQKKMQIDFRKTLKINGLLKWYREFFMKLDEICLDELKDNTTKKGGII